MKIIHRLGSAGLLLATVFVPCIQASSVEATAGFSVQEIAPGIHLHQGRHVPFDHPRTDDIANSGFIVGSRCVAVIDPGGSLAVGQALLDALRSTTAKPVCYVINTHVHFDHLLGNGAFASLPARFIGHQNLAGEVDGNRLFFLERYGHYLGPDPDARAIVGPDEGVQDTMELDLGERTLVLRAHHTAHSHSDLSILDTRTGTLWLSDLLFAQRIPALDGDLRGWIKTLHDLDLERVNLLVPGHGRPGAPGSGTLRRQLDYLEMLRDEVREAIAGGAFMEDIVNEVGKEDKKLWLLHEQHHRRNVTKAFTELEWE